MSAVSTRGCFSPLQKAHPQVLRHTLEFEEREISRLADKAVCQAMTGWTEVRFAAEVWHSPRWACGDYFTCSFGCRLKELRLRIFD